MPMPLDAPLFLTGPPVGTGPDIPYRGLHQTWLGPGSYPNPSLKGVPTHEMFVNAGLAFGGIQQPCSAL